MYGRFESALVKRVMASALVVAVPRTYFCGGFPSPRDDTARLQAFVSAGGGWVPPEWGELTIRKPIEAPFVELSGARIWAPDGFKVTCDQLLLSHNVVRSGGSFIVSVVCPETFGTMHNNVGMWLS